MHSFLVEKMSGYIHTFIVGTQGWNFSEKNAWRESICADLEAYNTDQGKSNMGKDWTTFYGLEKVYQVTVFLLSTYERWHISYNKYVCKIDSKTNVARNIMKLYYT